MKYLTLYHVFENFMFKLPIVWLETAQGGRMFSIRDFRRLYKEVETSELNALKRFFSVAFGIEAVKGIHFRRRIEVRWRGLCRIGEVPALEAVLAKLGIKGNSGFLKYTEFSGKNSFSHFAQMVYAMRNVIVHNTETEWHLHYATLDDATCRLLEGFLMPSLEEICFALVGVKNPHVWYSNKNLALY